MSLYSDRDYSTSFRSRDGVERTRAAGEDFLSPRGGGMATIIFTRVQRQKLEFYKTTNLMKLSSNNNEKKRRYNQDFNPFTKSKLKFSILRC